MKKKECVKGLSVQVQLNETVIERKVIFRRENWYGAGILTKIYIRCKEANVASEKIW